VARAVRSQIELIPDLKVLEDELLGAQASHDLDRLQVLIDVARTGRSGYQAADWLRQHCHIDVGMCDHRRILATLSFADDMSTGRRLIAALRSWRRTAYDIVAPPPIDLPSPGDLQLESDRLPRDAFFAPAESIAADAAAGRICAEQLTPYPPGIPAVIPGERLNDAVIDYLRTGIRAGMNVPDATDTSLQTIKVVV
jgi:lysine decarboxylase